MRFHLAGLREDSHPIPQANTSAAYASFPQNILVLPTTAVWKRASRATQYPHQLSVPDLHPVGGWLCRRRRSHGVSR